MTFMRAVTVERERQSLTEVCSKDNGKKKNVIAWCTDNFYKKLDCKMSREK